MTKKIILASTSPRRKMLLEQIGLEFEVIGSTYEEDMTLDMEPSDLAKFLSAWKAREVASRVDGDAVVIGGDTFLVYEGELLWKPHTENRAREMLHLQRGKILHVITWMTVIDTATWLERSEASVTEVHMREYTDDEIEAYIATGEPLDKAWAWAIQGKWAVLVKKINWCNSSIIWLPLPVLWDILKEFGVEVW